MFNVQRQMQDKTGYKPIMAYEASPRRIDKLIVPDTALRELTQQSHLALQVQVSLVLPRPAPDSQQSFHMLQCCEAVHRTPKLVPAQEQCGLMISTSVGCIT